MTRLGLMKVMTSVLTLTPGLIRYSVNTRVAHYTGWFWLVVLEALASANSRGPPTLPCPPHSSGGPYTVSSDSSITPDPRPLLALPHRHILTGEHKTSCKILN